MDIKIPFESIVKFKATCFEITKMSLEHEYTINDETVLGNFIVSGEYKTYEISVNKDTFNYTLPFQVELNNNIDLNTVELDIDDFTYELIGNDSLKINIVYNVRGELMETTEFERVDDLDLDEELEHLDEIVLEEEIEEPVKENEEEVKETNEVEEEPLVVDEDVRNIDQNTQADIINSISSEESYVTYHIHIVKENETLESISALYKINLSVLTEYNDLTEINIGDKVLIPFDNE